MRRSTPRVYSSFLEKRLGFGFSWGRLHSVCGSLQLAEGFSPNFFGFVYGRCVGTEARDNYDGISGEDGFLEIFAAICFKTK
jgi:hypothetical protein